VGKGKYGIIVERAKEIAGSSEPEGKRIE